MLKKRLNLVQKLIGCTFNAARTDRERELMNQEGCDPSRKVLLRSYEEAPFLSIKHSSYFQVYADLLEKYRNQDVTFVEIGVFNGGSLHMWRSYLGPQARIIGVDLNPLARRWEAEGFEIHIGDQADPKFWESFFRQTGMVDVVLDDGGHTFEQQIVTASSCVPFVNDGGLLIIEDTHTSYFRQFGYPTSYSFIEWTKLVIDSINSRFPGVNEPKLSFQRDAIYSLGFFESMVVFHVDRTKCFRSSETTNGKPSIGAIDFRYNGVGDQGWRHIVARAASYAPGVKGTPVGRWVRRLFVQYSTAKSIRRVRKYFRS